MQDRKRLRKQLEQQAKQIESQNGAKLMESLLATCGALLRTADGLAAELPEASEFVYASYLSMAQRINTFCEQYHARNQAPEGPGAERLRQMLEDIQARQRQAEARQKEAEALQRECVRAAVRNRDMEKQIEDRKRKLSTLSEAESGLKTMLEEFSEEKISWQREKNQNLLSELTANRDQLEGLNAQYAEMAGEKDRAISNIAQIEAEIRRIPPETVQLLSRCKELEGSLRELQAAETACSPEQQRILQEEIDRLLPIVQEHQVAADTLKNRLGNLEEQKTVYDRDRRQLTTNVVQLIQESMAELKELLREHEAFLDETERTADALSRSILACQQKRDEYRNWLDADETPLTAMMSILGNPENERLQAALDVGQAAEIKDAFAQTQKNLETLDRLLEQCAAAAQEDLKRIKRRANP